MVALFMLLVAALGDFIVSNKFIVSLGYADIKYEGKLVREFNYEFARLRYMRSFFVILSFISAVVYELTNSNNIIFLVLLFSIIWLVFLFRDAMRAKRVVDEFKIKCG